MLLNQFVRFTYSMYSILSFSFSATVEVSVQYNKAKYLHSQNQWYFDYFTILLHHHTSLNILINIFNFWWRFRHWQTILINMLDLNSCCWLYWWFWYIKDRDHKQYCTLRDAGARASGHTESSGGHSERGHVLLGLKEDDVDLWSEEAAQHYWTAQTHRDAHGSGLYLREYTQKKWLHHRYIYTVIPPEWFIFIRGVNMGFNLFFHWTQFQSVAKAYAAENVS